MLKGIDPLLNADVLYALRAMGHGDDVIIADTNFPSDSVARQTTLADIAEDRRQRRRGREGGAVRLSPGYLCRRRGGPNGSRR